MMQKLAALLAVLSATLSCSVVSQTTTETPQVPQPSPQATQATSPRPAAAQGCSACHGASGIAAIPETPHLAAQPASYLAAQLRAYRTGARRHEVMSVAAKALSESEIDEVAAWYASQRIELKSSP